ncbi:hypothetical protein SLEP1_g15141 [Rubroshorea leprosula]|uniref:Secreted protein n=1 Tax=Rubroshorea leprosula TaxID=152421 RepID=A0AAV5IVU0_9ROSI|nr:hypothetical protein SLEP1_g15141 [Rubroshorea leprosula]
MWPVSLPCIAAGCFCLVGANWPGFCPWVSPQIPGGNFPNLQLRFCWKIMEAKPRTGKPLEVTS